jgi:hypothetical protein
MKVCEMFVIGALILLGFALVSRFGNPSSVGISITFRDTGYVLPPRTISVGLATALCFLATIYSLWMLPFSRTAMLWHFWLTSIGVGVFWLSFYGAGSGLPNCGLGCFRIARGGSPLAANLRLESAPSDIQNAAAAWLM